MHNFSLELFIEEVVVKDRTTRLFKGSRLVEDAFKYLVDLVEAFEAFEVLSCENVLNSLNHVFHVVEFVNCVECQGGH